MKKEEFIEKARLIHGDKYDYSLVEYKNNKTNIIIKCNVCKKFFSQRPRHHLDGHGCPYCSKNKNYTTEEFIEKARSIHGDKYDYSLVEYKNSNTKIKIKCNICKSYFDQKPKHHLDGHGCFKCSKNKLIDFNLTTEYDGKNYREEYINLINEAKAKIPSVYEVHHILPKSMFPLWSKKENNLIKLSIENHYRAHYLLYKIYNNWEMTNAFKYMLDITGKEYNPELYKELKNKCCNPVYCYELDKEFNSASEAGSFLNLKNASGLYRNCRGKKWNNKNRNMHFCYVKDKEEAIRFWKQFDY